MSRWDYENVGASATPENRKYVQKIFEYIGYAPEPEYAQDDPECRFRDPDVYCCKYSACKEASGSIDYSFRDMDEGDLLYLLNALFPMTNVYVHTSEGNNTSDSYEHHDIIYDTSNMTCYTYDDYCNDYGDGPIGERSSKARFALEAPDEKYVNALIGLSTDDENIELTTLLMDLLKKLKNGLVIYKNDPEDTREIDEEYDIVDNIIEFENDDDE